GSRSLSATTAQTRHTNEPDTTRPALCSRVIGHSSLWGDGCVPGPAGRGRAPPRNYSRRAPCRPTRRRAADRKRRRPGGASPPAPVALTAGPLCLTGKVNGADRFCQSPSAVTAFLLWV